MPEPVRDPRWEKMWGNTGTGVSRESGNPYFYVNIYIDKKIIPFIGVIEFMDDPIYIDDREVYPQEILDDVKVFRELMDYLVKMADEFLDNRERMSEKNG